MSNMIDLSLLARETVDVKFDEDTIFTIPLEPSLEFSTKMVLARKKMERAKTDESKLNILQEVVTLILMQDDDYTKSEVEEIVGKLHATQVVAVFNIYEDQVEKNKANPN